eukprot:c25597_g1_i1 orf=161-1468(+)
MGDSSTESPPALIHRNRRRRYDLDLSSILQAPVHALLELVGVSRAHSSFDNGASTIMSPLAGLAGGRSDTDAEVAIRITAMGEADQIRTPDSDSVVIGSSSASSVPSLDNATNPVSGSLLLAGAPGTENGPRLSVRHAEASQRYNFQQLARWTEQVLPFSVLLLMVFVRQHLQGFLVTLWISAVMIKSNDLLQKQTALKGERKSLIVITIGVGLLLQIVGIYWWFKKENLFRPLLLLPPKEIPKFWHAVFIIVVNDMLVRQGAMVMKCGLLIYFKKTRGCHYRRQGQLLTFVEYLILLYRALLPAPVWYRFFLNKDYGSLFSSLLTGLYLTFKLSSVMEKIQTFVAALKALSSREVQYGSYATNEEVVAAGDLCAICQEKMHAPILLSCKHIFCEDCVSEWFDRESTCPLCRAIVKPAELRSFGDGSTSLFYQVF